MKQALVAVLLTLVLAACANLPVHARGWPTPTSIESALEPGSGLKFLAADSDRQEVPRLTESGRGLYQSTEVAPKSQESLGTVVVGVVPYDLVLADEALRLYPKVKPTIQIGCCTWMNTGDRRNPDLRLEWVGAIP